jgi:hypothetical protein
LRRCRHARRRQQQPAGEGRAEKRHRLPSFHSA